MDDRQHDYLAIFLDVGQGDATVISQVQKKESILIDAAAAQPVISALEQPKGLKAIFITHMDSDHIGGIPAIINWLSTQKCKNVRFFVNRQQTHSNTAARFRYTLNEAKEDGIIILDAAYNDLQGKIDVIGGEISILWPPHSLGVINPEDRNLDSLVLRFDSGAFRLLLGGDAEGNVWQRIDERELASNIFRYPHHGGKLFFNNSGWSIDDLISIIDPGLVIISVGRKNRYGHPSEEYLQIKLKHSHRQFLETTIGDIRCQIESSTCSINIQE